MSPAAKDQFRHILDTQVSTLNQKISSIVGDSNAVSVQQSGKLGLVILNEPLDPQHRYDIETFLLIYDSLD